MGRVELSEKGVRACGKMPIGTDIDGVLAELIEQFCPFHNEKYGTELTKDKFHSYHLREVIGCTKEEEFVRVMEFYDSPHFRDIRPSSGALEAISYLSKKQEIFAITSRPRKIAKQTWKWLNSYFPHCISELHLTNEWHKTDESGIRKSELCAMLGLDYFIEDHPRLAVECAQNGTHSFLYNQPWNQAISLPERVTRVYSWPEIVEKIQKEEFKS